jgi:hypothetical protein
MVSAANNQQGFRDDEEEEQEKGDQEQEQEQQAGDLPPLLLVRHPMLIEMLAMLERGFNGGSNPQDDDEGVSHDQLLIARVGVFLSVGFMAGIRLRAFTHILRDDIVEDDTTSIITFRKREKFRLRLRLQYSLQYCSPRGVHLSLWLCRVLELEAGNFPFLHSLNAYMNYYHLFVAASNIASPYIHIRHQYPWNSHLKGAIQWALDKGVTLNVITRMFHCVDGDYNYIPTI